MIDNISASPRSTPFWKRRQHPSLALWLTAPVFGELFSGSTPLNEYINPFSFLILGMLYGSGAILIRELIVRWRKGWISLFLLGAAYGIYEEGLVVRSFFDPNWIDLDKLSVYGRTGGVNWVWAEHLTVFHALISIAAAIVFVEILYPARRSESWIGARGIVWNAIAFAAMLPIGSMLNPYDAPDAWLGACWLAIVLLALAAWRLPTKLETAEPPSNVSPPRRFWWTAFLATFGQFFIVYFTADKNSLPFLITMLLIVLFDLFILWQVRRWSGGGRGWDDRHRLALISGSLAFFLILGPLTTNGKYPVMYFSNPVFLVLLWWIYRRVDLRVKSEDQT
ncbi:MAG: hypothetical protein AB9891_06760 [Anaerolineaceae bacterium]